MTSKSRSVYRTVDGWSGSAKDVISQLRSRLPVFAAAANFAKPEGMPDETYNRVFAKKVEKAMLQSLDGVFGFKSAGFVGSKIPAHKKKTLVRRALGTFQMDVWKAGPAPEYEDD